MDEFQHAAFPGKSFVQLANDDLDTCHVHEIHLLTDCLDTVMHAWNNLSDLLVALLVYYLSHNVVIVRVSLR